MELTKEKLKSALKIINSDETKELIEKAVKVLIDEEYSMQYDWTINNYEADGIDEGVCICFCWKDGNYDSSRLITLDCLFDKELHLKTIKERVALEKSRKEQQDKERIEYNKQQTITNAKKVLEQQGYKIEER